MSFYSYQPFTFVAVNLLTGSIMGEIPLTNVTFSKILNGNGQFQGTIDLNDPNTQKVDPVALTTPGASAIMVDYNGSLIGGWAALGTRAYDFEPQKRTLTLTLGDLWAYFAQRIQPTDYSSPPYSGITGPSTPMSIWNAAFASSGGTEVAWDPVLMAWQIISDTLSVEVPYSNILGGLSIAGNGYTSATDYVNSLSGTPVANYVAESYPFPSLQQVDTIVSQLTQLGYTVGFDRGFDVAYSNGPLSVPVGTVNLSYPRRGRTVAQNNLVCDLRAARSYQFPEDGSQIGNTIYETGTAGCIVALQNIYPLQQGWPILEKRISRSQVTSPNIQNLLFNIGLSDEFLYSYATVCPTVTVDLFQDNPQLGTFVEGDDMLCMLPATAADGSGPFDPRFPGGLYQEWRIQQFSCKVGDDGDSTMQFVLNQPPALTATQAPI